MKYSGIWTGRLDRMRHVWRYSAQPIIQRESVAEHSFMTAVIAMYIAIAYDKEDIDLCQTVCVRATLHDIEEAFTGDLVRDMKYFDPETRKSIRRVEFEFAKKFFESIGPPGDTMMPIWQYAKDSTLPGRIVALADLLSVFFYCHQERKLGNERLNPISVEVQRHIQDKFVNDKQLWPIITEMGVFFKL